MRASFLEGGLEVVAGARTTMKVGSYFPKLNLFELMLFLYINSVVINLMAGFVLGEGRAVSLITSGINAIVALYVAVLIIKEHMRFDVVVLIGTIGFFLLLAVAINPQLTSLAIDAVRRFLKCFCGYYLFARLIENGSLKRILPYCVLLMLPYCFLVLTSNSINHTDNTEYFPISYSIIIQVSLLFLFGARKISFLVVGLAGAVVVLFAGARGALVCIAVSVLMYIAYSLKTSRFVYKFFMIALLVGIVAFLIANLNQLLGFLYDILPTSRTLSYFTKSEIAIDNSRQLIYHNIIYALQNDPFAYRGLLSDRIVGGDVFAVGLGAGTYAHNFILEVLYQNGVVLGSVILIGIAVAIIKAFHLAARKAPDGEAIKVLIVLFSCSIIQLLYSNSYLICYPFWCLIGYIVNVFLVYGSPIATRSSKPKPISGKLRTDVR